MLASTLMLFIFSGLTGSGLMGEFANKAQEPSGTRNSNDLRRLNALLVVAKVRWPGSFEQLSADL